MGNFSSSCYCSVISPPAKLLDPRGALHRLGLPARAAELMLEYPGHFVCSLDGVVRTGRFVALRADDGVLGGKAYVMVPCDWINCRVRPEELAVIRSACKGRRQGREAKDADISRDVIGSKDGKEKKGGGILDQHRSGSVRSRRQWNPVLEPISET